MKKTILRGADKAARRGQKMVDLNKKLVLDNFPDVVQSINGKETNKNLHLYGARTYIGKIKKSGESIYSDDVLLSYMNYFFKKTGKGTHVDLVIAPGLSEILNGKESMGEYYSREEEKKHIINLAKKYFHERYRDLKIANIETLHPELFAALKEHGSVGLASSVKPILDKENFTSLDIAKYLYRVAKQNNNFMQKIYDLKTQEQKVLDKNPMGQNESDWYGLCEIAMRLTDFLKGTHVQGGVRRQKIYDDIIIQMLNKKIPVKYNDEVDMLRSFCQEVMKTTMDNNFYSIHFDTKKSEKIEEKYKEKEKMIKKITKNVMSKLLYVLLGSSVPLGIYTYREYQKEKEIKQEQNRVDEEFVSNQKMYVYGEYGGYEIKKDAEKIEYINKRTEEVIENISVRYDVRNDDEIKKIVRSHIKDEKNIEKFADGNDYGYNVFEVSDEFMRQYGDVFVGKNINKSPYDHLRTYEIYFKDVILDEDMLNEDKVIVHKETGSSEQMYPYMMAPPNNSYLFNVQLQCVNNGKKGSMVETKWFSTEERSELEIKSMVGNMTDARGYYQKDGYRYLKRRVETSYDYVIATKQYGEERKSVDVQLIAYDYFYQNRPIIGNIYEKFGAIYWGISREADWEKDQRYRRLKEKIKKMITKDLLQTGRLDKLPEDNDKMMMYYLEGFVKRNAVELGKDSIPTNAYESYQKEYKETFENTFKAQKDKNVLDIIKYEDRWEKYKFRYIGKYYTKQGVEYNLGEATIDGKKYLYARNVVEDDYAFVTEEGFEIQNVNYYFRRGVEVVNDFMGYSDSK